MTEPAITILERRTGNVRILADLHTGHAMPMYSADGRMPEGGPQAVHQVLKVVLEKVRNARLDLRATYFNTP